MRASLTKIIIQKKQLSVNHTSNIFVDHLRESGIISPNGKQIESDNKTEDLSAAKTWEMDIPAFINLQGSFCRKMAPLCITNTCFYFLHRPPPEALAQG